MNGWQRLKVRWGIQSDGQMAVVFTVFAITGSVSAWVARPVLHGLGMPELPWYMRIPIELVAILPIYPFILLFFGALFGQRKFFWAFVKRMLRIK